MFTSTIITVDGTAASGKGMLASRIAEHLNYAYLDTGILYRAVGQSVIQNGYALDTPNAAIDAARKLRIEDFTKIDLRSEELSRAASIVASIPLVRETLIGFQREFANAPPDEKLGAVIDGRDIGTVVCPEADRKIYVDANICVRARRRFKELRERGVDVIYSRILRNMRERDARDMSRSIAPLEPAKDAFVLDTTSLDADSAFAIALDYISS